MKGQKELDRERVRKIKEPGCRCEHGEPYWVRSSVFFFSPAVVKINADDRKSRSHEIKQARETVAPL